MKTRGPLRRLIPFPLRLELLRLKRLPGWLVETPTISRGHASEADFGSYSYLLAGHRSPLVRGTGPSDVVLQRGKELNVTRAASLIDGLVIEPNKLFSYHRTVGRPSRLRGFRMGLELHGGAASRGIGGGCCMVSNLLYLLALRGGMKIVERHRHGLDLFPDHERTVPFGCGATVVYNYADFRFENPLPQSILIRLQVVDNTLQGELRATAAPGWRSEVYEVGHRFLREGDVRYRENRIHRRFVMADGTVLLDQEVAHNRGRVLYDVPDDSVCGALS
jgi:vancomycin resistance protein VanW